MLRLRPSSNSVNVGQSAYILLGKAGDIFSALPIVQADPEPNIVVSERYSSVLDGISSVNAHVYPGEWDDLHRAIRWAKSRFARTIVLQTYGNGFPIQHKCPNFQHDQYLRAGRLKDFGKLPLELPRNLEIDASKYNGERPFILIADESQSSPFPHRQQLFEAFASRFGATYKIVKTSDIGKMSNIKDFLPIYDAAKLVVTVDTAHLHMTAASTTPVIAFASDIKQRWQGSAWTDRFAFYCRYSQFQGRIDEMLSAADSVLFGKSKPQVEIVKTRYEHGYNMGIIRHGERVLMPYRYHPEKGKWRTTLVMQDGGTTLPILVPEKYRAYSIEDPKPFMFQGSLHLCYVVSTYPAAPAKCIIAYGRLKASEDAWIIEEQYIPKYGSNDFSAMQKNWALFESDTRLYAIYGSDKHQTVLQLNGNGIVNEFQAESPKWSYGEIRGGVVLPYKDRFIRFFHSLTGNRHDPYNFRYHIGALTMDTFPPFRACSVMKNPIISGDERWIPDCAHYKPNVMFPGGAIKEGDEFVISIGINDCQSALVRVKESDLNL